MYLVLLARSTSLVEEEKKDRWSVPITSVFEYPQLILSDTALLPRS
jgi:uncharacterized protein YceK